MFGNSIKIYIPGSDDRSPADIEVNGTKIDHVLGYSVVQKEGEDYATVDLKFDAWGKVDISLNENALKAKRLR